jgi:hypothetical protein
MRETGAAPTSWAVGVADETHHHGLGRLLGTEPDASIGWIDADVPPPSPQRRSWRQKR